MVGVTFALYSEQSGGAPLWLETQNVQPDKYGHYTVVLGSTKSEGLPVDLFVSEQAHWVGVQASGQNEQPRVLLLSVPYALKALDAETIGGKPASAFMAASGNAASGNSSSANTITGSGKKDYVPLWLSTTKLGSSKLFQSAAGDLGVGTTTPAANLDVNGTSDIRNTLTLFPNGSAPTLSVNGTAFAVSNKGLVSFVSGQTYPGAGTVTSVGTGLGLTGGPVTTSGTLAIDTTVVPQLKAQNNFVGVQTITANNDLNALQVLQNGTGDGIDGAVNNATGYGVVGVNIATSGTGVGVEGISDSSTGYGVGGQSPFVGVYGTTNTDFGIGVYATATANTGGIAVEGVATSGRPGRDHRGDLLPACADGGAVDR